MANKPHEPRTAPLAEEVNDAVPRRQRRRQLSVDESLQPSAGRQLHTEPLQPPNPRARDPQPRSAQPATAQPYKAASQQAAAPVREPGVLPPMGPLHSASGRPPGPRGDGMSAGSFADSAVSERPKPMLRFWHGLLILVAIMGLGVVCAATAVYFTVEHYAEGLPSPDKLKQGYAPPQITRILARDGTLLSSVFTERRTVIPFDQVPDAAKLAFLAAEDAGFYEHEGLNYFGMLRALYTNIRRGHSVQGGSSITQQVVKNVLLDAERSYQRKIKEGILSFRLEHSLTKDEILWLYLNHIYLGHGRYGIEEASRFYFGKHAKELSLDEAAILAGLIAAPERYSPRRDPEKSLQRRRYVLEQMLKKGFVTQQLFQEVSERPLRLAPTEESESRLAPEVVDLVKERFGLKPGARAGTGHTVHTTIDPELQAAARKAVRDNLDQYMVRHKLVAPFVAKEQTEWGAPFAGHPVPNKIYVGVVASADDHTGTIDVNVGDVTGKLSLSNEERYNPTHLLPSAFTKPGAVLRVSLVEESEAADPATKPTLRLELGPQSALVALDVRSRAVLALVGGYEAVTGGLDRATETHRQPGSTFKPLVYSYALHSHKFTPASMFAIHKPVTGSVSLGGQNFLSVRNGLAQSNNEVSTQLFARSGPKDVVTWAHALGIESRLEPDMSLALGAYEVSPLEMANAYAAFASGGRVTPAITVTKLESQGVIQAEPPPVVTQAMTAEEAYLTTSLLRGVIEVGTGQAARRLGRELAGKTGTTNDSRDTWFVGFSTDIVAAVWVGYDDARPLGKNESGSKTALPAWVSFMEAAHKNRPKTVFARPSGILVLDVDPGTGLLPRPGQTDVRSEEFLPGTEPNTVAAEPPSAPPSDGAGDPSLLPAPALEPTANPGAGVPAGAGPDAPAPGEPVAGGAKPHGAIAPQAPPDVPE